MESAVEEKINIELERKKISEESLLASFQKDLDGLHLDDMLTVYQLEDNNSIYSTLIPSAKISEILVSSEFNYRVEEGMPSTIIYYSNGKKEPLYFRFGVDNGLEPIVIKRNFDGLQDEYFEISEEFRLFHNLYNNKKLEEFYKFDNVGNKTLVAIIEKNKVKIRLRELRQFLAIKEMHLLSQCDYRKLSSLSLMDLALDVIEKKRIDDAEMVYTYSCNYDNICNNQTFSRLLGKKLILPLTKSQSGFLGFSEEKEKKNLDFLIGLDENGVEKYSTSQDKFLTPVYFKKEVLDKYYQQASKYSVEESILRYGYLWSVFIDNMDEDIVAIWLGDILQSLPYQEQLHWKQYNIAPTEGMSETFLENQLFCEFKDSEQSDHSFRRAYLQLEKTCDKYLGWQILLKLKKEDEYHLKRIRILSTEEQGNFDALILDLTKILIDSLNMAELKKIVIDEKKEETRSISLLQSILEDCNALDASKHLSFLRGLQELRSSGMAHRKGDKYIKNINALGFEEKSLKRIAVEILTKSVDFLYYINELITIKKISSKKASL